MLFWLMAAKAPRAIEPIEMRISTCCHCATSLPNGPTMTETKRPIAASFGAIEKNAVAGLGRLHGIAPERSDDVEREALELEADIERDEIVGRDHHHHARRREQDEDGELEARDALALVVGDRHHDAEGRGAEHKYLHER